MPCTTPSLDAVEKPTAPLPIKSIPSNLRVKPAELVPILRKQINDLIVKAAKSRDVIEFRRIRDNDFSEYSAFIHAISKFVVANVDLSAQKKLVEDTLIYNEHCFKLAAPELFGLDATNAAIFYFVTYRKMFDFVAKIKDRLPISDPEQKKEDFSLARRFVQTTTWVSYHYELMHTAAAKKLTLANDVLAEVLIGMKFVDIAFVCVKQAYALRYPEKIIHRSNTEEHPCDHISHGSVEKIAADAVEDFEEWATFRDRANNEAFPH